VRFITASAVALLLLPLAAGGVRAQWLRSAVRVLAARMVRVWGTRVRRDGAGGMGGGVL